MSGEAAARARCCARPSTPGTSPPAPGWSTSAAGTCPSSTRPASSPSTSPRAAAPACSTSPTWAASCCAAPAPRRSSSTCSPTTPRPWTSLQAQYTMVPTETGGAVDDAYLYRFVEGEYLLVVNASNRQKDWDHFHDHLARFPDVELTDETGEIAMLALQGTTSRDILGGLIESGGAARAAAQRAEHRDAAAAAATGASWRRASPAPATPASPSASSSSSPAHDGPALWDALVAAGAVPVGLGARDTLRLEAGLPLYGHELGVDPEGARSPSSAARWPRSRSASRRSRASSSAAHAAGAAARRPTRASCSATTRCSTTCRGSPGRWP